MGQTKKIQECGMFTFRPLITEYTPEIREYFITKDWSEYFDKWLIVEEQKNHLHIPFQVKYNQVGKPHAERFLEKLLGECPDVFENKNVACYFSWPKNKDDTFVKVCGYVLKGVIQIEQNFEILLKHNIDDKLMSDALESAKKLTQEKPTVFLSVPEICIKAQWYVKENQLPTFTGFQNYIAEEGWFYNVTDAKLESLYDQAARIQRNKKI